MAHLRVVEKDERQDEIVACHVCNSTTLIPVVVGAHWIRNGDPEVRNECHGGTDQLICAQCLAEGKIEVVVDDASMTF
jgi:hypothetical protein